MANLHVDSTTAGTPTSPYSTWATAATTINAASLVAVAGDTIYVHPSHSETAATAGLTGAGTAANPIKIVCGTPDTTSGITALQTSAIFGINPSGSGASWTGSFYVYGISFRVTGSTGSATLRVASSNLEVCTLEKCAFYFGGSNGAMSIGVATEGTSIVNLINCDFRFHNAFNSFRFNSRVYGSNLAVVSSAATPTTMFAIGDSGVDNSAFVDIDGLDFATLANTTKLTSTFSEQSFVRFRNLKVPTGWGVLGTTNPLSGDLLTGSQLELLNYGDGDTNHKYWVENKQGRSLAESTIKVNTAIASGNSTGTYSRRMQTLANVAYPNAPFRGPSISKYVVANGQQKGIFLNVMFDGTPQFTNKEFWIEVTARTVTGFSHTVLYSSCPNFTTAPVAIYAASETWDGATGTGPNGSSVWNAMYVYVGGIPVREDGWITVTPCFAVPSKTIFVNDSFEIEDEGAI